MRSKWWGKLATAVVVLAGAVAVRADGDGPRDLLKRMLDAAPRVPFTANLVMSSSRGWTRELALKHKNVEGSEATYMEVMAPHDVAGTRFLFLERAEGADEQYIYVPMVKRAIRVADEARKQAFLGSDFYVSDLVAPDLDSYTYAFSGDETIEGRKCKLVESVPKQADAELYSKTVLAIDPEDLVLMRTQFYDKKGALLKVWTIKKLDKVDGHWTPLEQEMVNVQDSTSSELKMADVKYNVELADDDFSRSRLTR